MRKGFTLLELIMVVGIIGLLASIFIPSFQKAREKAIAEENVRANSGVWSDGYMTNGYSVKVAFEYDGMRVYEMYKGSSGYHYFFKEIK